VRAKPADQPPPPPRPDDPARPPRTPSWPLMLARGIARVALSILWLPFLALRRGPGE
jgi:hypothetical protein